VATDLTGDPYLEALADLYGAAIAASRVVAAEQRCTHKGRRLDAGFAYQAIGHSYRAAWEAIESRMREHPQPVQFVHDGWRWTIPSAGRGLICVPVYIKKEVTA
jgi:hypothetical protein